VAEGVGPEFKPQYSKKKKNQKTLPNELNRQYLKEQVQMGNKYMKNCSTSLSIKEMQI
jgi:hypothetical protein